MHNLESEKRNDYLEKALKDKSLILLPKKSTNPIHLKENLCVPIQKYETRLRLNLYFTGYIQA